MDAGVPTGVEDALEIAKARDRAGDQEMSDQERKSQAGQTREYPGKLYHGIPPWVEPGAMFHIRLRVADGKAVCLTEPRLAERLMASVRVYEEKVFWFNHLFLLMPDHIHAILSFSRQKPMSQTIGEWKKFHSRANRIQWQDNYFDHRLRHVDELIEKAAYIRNNPVVKGLCVQETNWPWVLEMAGRNGGEAKVDAGVLQDKPSG